jgi:hypothetical protein
MHLISLSDPSLPAIIAGVVFVVISVTTLTDSKAAAPIPVVPPPQSTTMRDIGVGDARLDDEDDALLDMRLKGLGGWERSSSRIK